MQLIKYRLDRESRYRPNLFCRGYLITDAKLEGMDGYPFYGLWQRVVAREYEVWVHPEATVSSCTKGDWQAIMIGHAYNPYTDEISEEKILEQILDAAAHGAKERDDAIDSLTGVFVIFLMNDRHFWATQDCGGQKMLYFGKIYNHVVLTSIPQLAGDIFDLQWDKGVERLLHTKGYYRGSGFLPGNLSPYQELTRLGANTSLTYDNTGFHISRIYPRTFRKECVSEEEKALVMDEIYRIFTRNISLAIQKWPRVGLSLTGGVDSKTTFACAKGQYDRLFCYSYQSKPSEELDAKAAKEICRAAGAEHHLYIIPEDPAQVPDYEFLRALIEHNTSHTCKLHPNEIRKYIWLREQKDFDVEIKSDISEIGRAYTSRKYYKVRLPQILSPRHLSIGQGRYFLEPWAFRFADRTYASFMDETGLKGDILGYSMHDLVYWEVRMSSWAATSLASQEYIHEITIPYNNRKLMDLFLRFPEEDRLEDLPHKLLMLRGNLAVANLDCSVKDSYFGKKRMLLETFYYYYATRGNTLGSK